MAIEVLSSVNKEYDRIDKYTIYEKFKIKEFWIIDPENSSIEIYTLENTKYMQLGLYNDISKAYSQILKGFAVSFKELTERILF